MTMWSEMENPPLLERLRRKFSTFEEKFDISPEKVKPLVSMCLGFKRDGKWKLGWVAFGEDKTYSLFYNGILFIRIMFPFFIGLGIRWSGTGEGREFMQTYLPGWKLNGQVALFPRFRIQSDKSAATGTTGPNIGQASGWNEGTK